jgi:hypothetical protein
MDYVRHELSRGLGDWEQRLNTAIVKSRPADLVKRDVTKAEEHLEHTKA